MSEEMPPAHSAPATLPVNSPPSASTGSSSSENSDSESSSRGSGSEIDAPPPPPLLPSAACDEAATADMEKGSLQNRIKLLHGESSGLLHLPFCDCSPGMAVG